MKKLLLNNIFRNEPPERLFFRISTAGGFIAIVFFSVSVSLSQFGLFLAVSGWIALNLYQKFSKKMIESENIWKMPFRFPHLLFPASGIYISLLFSYFINTLNGEMTKHVFKTEVRDLFLIGAALWVISYSSDERGRERIFRWLKIAFWVTVTAGFFSIFSKYRLAKIPHHLIHGWEVSSLARFQHHAG
ncbi:MAG: hypothetical protein OEZ34_12940, partial [Spirochaetia bacterium]|nr:hypothetical protein [Spirochaetia bacterium]